MVGAKRARTAETPKLPSYDLRLRAPYFYPDPRCSSLSVSCCVSRARSCWSLILVWPRLPGLGSLLGACSRAGTPVAGGVTGDTGVPPEGCGCCAHPPGAHVRLHTKAQTTIVPTLRCIRLSFRVGTTVMLVPWIVPFRYRQALCITGPTAIPAKFEAEQRTKSPD